MTALLKKIFLVFLISFIFFFVAPSKILAQGGYCAGSVPGKACSADNCQAKYGDPGVPTGWQCSGNECCVNAGAVKKWFEPQSFNEFQEGLYGLPISQVSDQRFTARMFSNIIDSMNLSIHGKTIKTNPEGTGYNDQSGGAIAFASNLITSIYNYPPASGIEYLADLGKSFGFVSPVYAQQGIGFNGLAPILPLWKAIRNIAYALYTVIFIVIGLSIMFRKKISPQAVITIESALPNLIVSLIAVTFSYAIAGFLIDLVYVAIDLIVVILSFGGLIPAGEVTTRVNQIVNGGFPQVIGAVLRTVEASGAKTAVAAIGFAMGALVGTFSGGLAILPGAVLGVGIALLVLGGLILYILFKLFLALLSAYFGIIVNIIISPILLMMGALPGSSVGSFGKWIKNLLGDLLLFPAVAGFLIISQVILKQTQGGQLWSPPMLAGGEFIASTVPTLLSLGMLLFLNKIPEMIKKLFDEKYKGGSAIGDLIGAPAGFAIGVGTKAWGLAEGKLPFTKGLMTSRLKKQAQEKAEIERQVAIIKGTP